MQHPQLLLADLLLLLMVAEVELLSGLKNLLWRAAMPLQ
jgi:hypothetical protein